MRSWNIIHLTSSENMNFRKPMPSSQRVVLQPDLAKLENLKEVLEEKRAGSSILTRRLNGSVAHKRGGV